MLRSTHTGAVIRADRDHKAFYNFYPFRNVHYFFYDDQGNNANRTNRQIQQYSLDQNALHRHLSSPRAQNAAPPRILCFYIVSLVCAHIPCRERLIYTQFRNPTFQCDITLSVRALVLVIVFLILICYC